MKKRIVSFVMCLALIFTLSSALWLSLGVSSGAAEVTYSNVLDDLKKDESFNEADYPSVPGDYSLKVIQIAESESGELFLYVYQPGESIVFADKVNMSDTGTVVGLRNCKLVLVDYSGVFQKYKVMGIERSNEFVRKYFIVSIYRPWNDEYGDTTSEGSIGASKVYPVEVIWTASTALDGRVTYTAEYSEDTITVTSSCVGFFYYDESSWFDTMKIESHYFAFSSNKPIDNIQEAYIEYSYTWQHRDDSAGVNLNDSGLKTVVLSNEQVFEKMPDGNIFSGLYSYKRIQSTEDFLKAEGVDLTEEAYANISNQSWILRFAETDYAYRGYPYRVINTDIEAVSLFRLRYIYADKIYDVGVVSDIIGEDEKADGYGDPQQEEWWQKIMFVLAIILLIVGLSFLKGPVGFIFGILKTGLVSIFSLLWSIVMLPFNIVKALFGK